MCRSSGTRTTEKGDCSMTRITTSTPQQWNRIDKLKNRVIKGLTDQPGDDRIRKVVMRMWERMGYSPKAILISDCPISGAIWLDWLKETNSQLRSQLGSQLHSQLGSQLDSQLYSQLYSQLGSQLDSQLCSQLDSQLYSQLDSQLYSQLGSQLNSQLDSQLRSQLYSQLYISLWWRACAAWYEGATILGVKFSEDIYSLFKEWSLCVPVIYANSVIPVVSRFPVEIHWKGDLLHNESSPSVLFKSGWRLWSIDGFPVDEQIVMQPETQTIEQIDKEENQDVKSIRISRFGWPRYIKESGAQCLDKRKNEVEGTREALFQCKDGSKILVVTCPTRRIFALGVPLQVQTCHEAQSWLHGGKKINVIAAT